MDNMVKSFVVYSPNEAFCNDGAGFWSNTFGWSLLEHATKFSAAERASFPMPISLGRDARYVCWQQAHAHYG